MSRRETWWPVATVALCVALVFIVLGTGPLQVAAGDVVANVLGDAPQYDFAVQVTGLPPALLGIVVGACFGAAGALVQSLTRNPRSAPPTSSASTSAPRPAHSSGSPCSGSPARRSR